MSKFTSANGETYDFHIDLDAVLEMEAENPDFSILDLADKMAEKFRFTDLVMMAKIIGWDYKDFCERGFNIQDLSAILTECLSELGFTSAQDVPSS